MKVVVAGFKDSRRVKDVMRKSGGERAATPDDGKRGDNLRNFGDYDVCFMACVKI